MTQQALHTAAALHLDPTTGPAAAEPDPAAVEAFGQRILETINGGALAMMISIGHRTGLFDVMAGMAPSTSEGIAEQAGLNERYVREWLGAMVTGRIVVVDPASGTYHLPAEHANKPNELANLT